MQTRHIFAFFIFMTTVSGVASVYGHDDTGDQTDDLTQLSDEELAKRQHEAGLDDVKASDLIDDDQPKKGPGAATSPQVPPTFQAYLDRLEQEHPGIFQNLTPEQLEEYTLGYAGKEMEAVKRPVAPLKKAGTTVTTFINKYVRGRTKEHILLVSYILYRQVTWLMMQRLAETNPKKIKEQPITESILGCTPLGGRAFKMADFMIRFGFSGLQLYLDLVNKYAEMQLIMKHPEMMGKQAQQNPYFLQEMMRDWVQTVQRAWSFFSYPTYYGPSLGMFENTAIALTLPFIWSAYLSKYATGNPFNNKIFRYSSRLALSGITSTYALRLQSYLNTHIKQSTQERLFDRSFGIAQPRFARDVVLDAGSCLGNCLLDPDNKEGFVPQFTRAVGKRAIDSVVMHVLVGILAYGCRHGVLQKMYGVSRFLSQIWVKLGIAQKNPVDTAGEKLASYLVKNDLLAKGKPLSSALDTNMVRFLFPGAFAKAVQRVITKKNVSGAITRSPNFISALSDLEGLTTFKMFNALMINPMEMMTLQNSTESVRRSLAPRQVPKIMTAFFNEIMQEVLLNREHIGCQMITETILRLFVGGSITRLQTWALPSKAA